MGLFLLTFNSCCAFAAVSFSFTLEKKAEGMTTASSFASSGFSFCQQSSLFSPNSWPRPFPRGARKSADGRQGRLAAELGIISNRRRRRRRSISENTYRRIRRVPPRSALPVQEFDTFPAAGFSVITNLVTPFWLLMLLAPGWSFTERVMRSPYPIILCALVQLAIVGDGLTSSPPPEVVERL